MYRLYPIVIFVLLFSLEVCAQQPTNTDPAQSYINVALPRTPESQGFEKYGNIPVNEFTGQANISVPLCTVKSRFLEAPVTLSYMPGIKISQEASWVGLGWDLNAGGRITVETRGAIDNDNASSLLFSPTALQTGMQQIFTRLNNLNGSNKLGILTYGCTCFQCYQNPGDPHAPGTPDDWGAVNAMAQFGLGEPDIFHANFMGNSMSFYFDKITGALSFIGEKNLFNINYTTDAYGRVTTWTITDNMGVQYLFTQKETTTVALSSNAIFFGATSTSAWLLTQVLHPTGDFINFSYSNYGSSYPAYNWSAYTTRLWNNGELPLMGLGDVVSSSQDYNQVPATQQPYYLTKIETSDVAVNFFPGSRTDLNGAGSKRLDSLTVLDKATNSVRKKVSFGYDYFTATFSGCYIQPLSDGNSYNNAQRLRLSTLSVNDMNGLIPPYHFYYNNNSGGQIPSKYSFDQDHWGYYNAAGNNQYLISGNCTPQNLIPSNGTGVAVNTTLTFTGHAVSRECNPLYTGVMSLDSMVYPTGGSSRFIYEPHQASFSSGGGITGGGLRIKSIRNYSLGKLAGYTDYTYVNGLYMGTIEYGTSSWRVGEQSETVSVPPTDERMDVLSSNGALNDNDELVAYPAVTITQKDQYGNTNGSEVKTFNISAPGSTPSPAGFQTAQPVWPTGTVTYGGSTAFWDLLNPRSLTYLFPATAGYAPTPIKQLDGKLALDQFFDKSGNLIKSINYYYHQQGYTEVLYDIKVKDNTIGSVPDDLSFISGGRRYTMFVSPAKSWFTLKDSVVETTYDGANSVKQKQSFLYNSYNQPSYTTQYNSDGTQTINYTRMSAEINVPVAGPPSGQISTLMYQMKNAHIYDLPVEQIVVHRGTAGDSTVVSSRFNVYQGPLPLQVYIMETAQPLTLGSQFLPWYYTFPTGSTYAVAIDPHYQLYSLADYSSNNLTSTLHTLQGNKAFIWDEGYNTVLAACTNADSANVAFTSFETAAKGRWTYSQSGVAADNSAPTGGNAYALSTVNITVGGLTSSRKYIVSYWSKTGNSYTVTGTSSTTRGKTINGWTYFEHTVTGVTTVAVSGTGSIDELRLYPSDAQMTSYTYAPLFGITSQSDAAGRVSYYFYDILGRLKWIKDQDGNILKTYQYHYQSIPGVQY